MAVLAGVAHVVEHRLGLPALAHGEHDARRGLLVGEIVRRAEEHMVIEMDVIIDHEAADGEPLRDILAHDAGKALAGREHLRLARSVEQRTEAVHQFVRIVVHERFEIFRAALAAPVHLAAEIVIELAVAVKAETLAHFHDRRGGEEILARDLLDADALLAALDVRGNARDDAFFVLGQEVGQKKITAVHSVSRNPSPHRFIHYTRPAAKAQRPSS